MKDETSVLNGKTDRLYYLDWLRVMTIIAVFFHHCSRIFDLRNSHTITGILPTIHREFDNLWMMPLFFIISGAAIYYSLKGRKVGRFIKERFLRILLPLITVGIFVIAPPLRYLDQFFNGQFSGSFIEWYPHYFKTWNPAYVGHLWFLIFLFMYTFILLAFVIPFGKQKASIFLRFSGLFKKSWGLLLLYIPLIAIAPLEIYSGRLLGG